MPHSRLEVRKSVRPLRTHIEAEPVASEVEIVDRVQLLIGLSFCGLT